MPPCPVDPFLSGTEGNSADRDIFLINAWFVFSNANVLLVRYEKEFDQVQDVFELQVC